MTRYTLFKSGRTGRYYLQDRLTRKQKSLGTTSKTVAESKLAAHNETARVPELNRQLGSVYLTASDPEYNKRTWKDVAEATINPMDSPSTRQRKETAVRQSDLKPLLNLKLYETTPDHFLRIVRTLRNSSLSYVRRWHNFALDMRWLPHQLIPRRLWPKPITAERRAITEAEHRALVASCRDDSEWGDFFECLWWLGAAQTDLAMMTDDRIDFASETIRFKRVKIKARDKGLVLARMGPTLKEIIQRRYGKGYLFPALAAMHEKDRSTYFKRRCQRLGLPEDLVLHCYRHAVVQRAEACDFEKRLAMRLVGHDKEKTHTDYARTANVAVPSLEEKEIEFKAKNAKILPFDPLKSKGQNDPTNQVA